MKDGRLSPAQLRSKITDLIRSSLSKLWSLDERPLRLFCVLMTISTVVACRDKKAIMNYQNYTEAIIVDRKVELVGFPVEISVPFGPPGSIPDAELPLLLAALQQNICRFERRTDAQIKKIKAQISNRRTDGEKIGTGPRKIRSDKGKKRGRRGINGPTAQENREDSTSEQVTLKRKRTNPTNRSGQGSSSGAAKAVKPPISRANLTDTDISTDDE